MSTFTFILQKYTEDFIINFGNIWTCYGNVSFFLVYGKKIAKIKFSSKNGNFGQKSKFWSKIEILVKNWKFLVKNWNYGQKLKYWSKIEILVKNGNFWSKIEILVKKWKLWSKIEILVKNRNFGQKS